LDGSVTAIAAYDKHYVLHAVAMKASPVIITVSKKEIWTVSPNPTKDGVIKVQLNLKDKKTEVFRLSVNTVRLLMVKQVESITENTNIAINLEQKLSNGINYLQANGIEGRSN